MASAFETLTLTVIYLITVSVIIGSVGPYTVGDGDEVTSSAVTTTASVSCVGNCTTFSDVQDSSSSVSFLFDFLTFQVSGLATLLNLFVIVIPVTTGIGLTILAYLRGGMG